MFKKSGNPKIEELTKSHRERRINLSSIKPPERNEKRYCVWCNDSDLGRNKNRKYCSTECSDWAFAWANPQSDHGLHIFLHRQDFKCLGCQYDWRPLAEEIWSKISRTAPFPDKIHWLLMRRLKERAPAGRKPEVDHVLAISKGGESIGFSNHQVLCFLCHKAKTKIDISGPRVIDPVKAEKNRKKRVLKAVYERQWNFDLNNRQNYKWGALYPFYDSLTLDEVQCLYEDMSRFHMDGNPNMAYLESLIAKKLVAK